MRSSDLQGHPTNQQTPGGRPVHQVAASRRRAGRPAIARAIFESCESRMLLAANLRTKVATTITPPSVAQSLMAPGVNTFSLTTANSTTTAVSANYRFVLNNATSGETTQFTTQLSSGFGLADAAIALYDPSGNRIQLQDADVGSQTTETLEVALQSGVQYTVEFYAIQTSTAFGTNTLSLTVNPGPQALGDTLALNPATGIGTLSTAGAPNAFTSSNDVRYIPLNLFNASFGASVTITPQGPDTAVAADIFLQTSPTTYTKYATQTLAAGASSTTLFVTPPAGSSVGDNNYILVLAPLNFTAAPEPVTITASGQGTLAPTAVAPATVSNVLTETLTGVGTLQSQSFFFDSFTNHNAKVYSINAAVTGPMTLQYIPTSSYAPLVAAYGPGGTPLLGVASKTTAGSTVNLTFNAVAGAQYFLYAGIADSTQSGSFALYASQAFTPTAIAATSSLGQQSNLQIGPGFGAKTFRVTPAVGSNYVAIQLAPDAGSTLTATMSVVGADGTVRTVTGAAPGQPATLVIDQNGNGGPYDVFVTSPTGAGTASLKYTSLTVPTAISVNQFPTATLNFQNGGISSASLPVTTGVPVGFQYFQPSNGPGAASTLYNVAPVNSGATAILLHYVQEGSTFRLVDSASPTGANTSANVFVPARGQTLHAVVALPVNFSGSGQVQLTVGGPKPTGVGLGTVPNALPGQGTPPGGYQSIASLANGKLATAPQRDLYSVQVPFNASSTTATLQYTPGQSTGPLTVTVNVLNASNVVVATATSTAGGSLSIPVTGLVAGQPIRFEVKSVAGTNLGTGAYGLSIAFATTNPLPYLVTQQFFYPYTSSQVAGRSYLPNGVTDATIPTIPVNGSLQGNFASSTPYNNNGTGSIQVFKVNGWTDNTAFTITTSDVDASVNTNIALFYLSTDTSGNTAYKRLRGTAPSFDYLPGDRTSVDSKIVVNNTDLDPAYALGEFGGPITVYAVVMNEQGTQGRYTISATQPIPPNTAGPGNTTPANIIQAAPRTGGQFLFGQQKTTQTANGTTFSLRTPSDMSGSGTPVLTVKTNDFSLGQSVTVSIGRGIVFVGSASGTVGSGGVVNIQLLGTVAGTGQVFSLLGPNQTYQVTVTASSFPTSGLTLSLVVPYATVSGTVPPSTITGTPLLPTDAAFSSSLVRMRPTPTGTITESVATDGAGTWGAAFNVSKAGAVSFTINSASAGSPAVGLYQAGKSVSGQPYTDVSVLLDFDQTRTSNNFVLGANLPAGTYWLRGQGFDDSAAITVTGTIPALPSRVLEVEPATGLTQQSEQTIINQYAAGSTSGATNNGFSTSRYASSLFKLVVPSNASGGPVTFTLDDVSSIYAASAPTPPVGAATLSMYRFSGGIYTRVASAVNAVNATAHTYTLSAGEAAVAGAEYFVDVDFSGFQYAAYVGFTVPIFTTGVGDYAVQPITLTANAGSTLVQSAIVNGSFSSAPAGSYSLQLGGTTSTRSIPTLAPFGSLSIFLPWQPGAASDVVSITANPTSAVPELSRTNNVQSKALATVDANAPSATISLADAAMTGEGNAAATTGGGTWGRYVAGVPGQATTIRVSGADANADLYQIVAKIQNGNGTFALDNLKVFNTTGTSSFTQNIPFDFGTLGGTTLGNLNQLKFYAIDVFGLKTPTYIQTLDVATRPSFLVGGTPAPGVSGAGGTVTFNAAQHKFTYSFADHIISLNKSLSDLLGIDVPVIGDKTNEFLVEITGTGTSTLNPNVLIPLELTGHAKLTALDSKIFEKTYTGGQINPNVSFHAQMALDGKSLIPGSTSVSLQVTNLELLNYKTPLIPLLHFGVPGLAELKAGVKFGVNAHLNAGAKIGFDPLAGGLGGYLGSLGVMSPTFVQPTITGTATVVGEADVLGFDIADVSGSLGLTLTLTLGLDNNVPGRIVPFAAAAGGLGLTIDAQVHIHLSASVFIIGEVYSYDYNHDFGNIVNTVDQGIFLTDPPSFAAGKFIGPANRPGAGHGSGNDDGIPIIRNGSSLVGAYAIDPTPQIAINNSVANGMGLSAQVVNAGTATAPLGNLAVTTRNGGAWSSLTTLTGANDVSGPELALSHDGTGTPGVVVYAVDNVAGSPAGQTFNQRLNSQDIRYRYFNGTSWGSEIGLTSDSLFDSQQTLAFNASGAGVLAFVHNTNGTPMSGAGVLDAASNEIQASAWNATTHTWGAPVSITSGGGSDSSPSTFVDAGGKRYVVWINTNGVSQLMYSTNTGGAWSAPAVLSTTGLAAGGTFKNVSIGSDGAGRADVVFSYTSLNADDTVSTTLYHRPATTATFANALPVAQLAANSTFSGLRTTNAPSGALVAYWQQSDGQSNQIYEVTINNGVATTPTQISTSPNIAKRPSAAVDGDGKIQLLYTNSILSGGTSQGTTTDPAIGAPLAAGVASSSIASLPQLTFTQGLAFPVESQSTAAIGSTITGTAVIANRGLVSATVTITAYNGPNGTGTVAGTQTVVLAPGATYTVSQAFAVRAGTQQYSLKLTTAAGQAFNTTENVSTATLRGLGDLSVSLVNDVGSPAPGSAQNLQAFVQNNSASAVGSFVVTLYAGDPLSPQSPLTVLGTQTVSGLAASAGTMVSFPVTLGAGAGDNIYTAFVDSSELIAESNENNNMSRYEVGFRADPAIVVAADGSPPVVATLLNGGASNNVRVDVNVANLGAANLVNVPVNLSVSRNGGPAVSLGQVIIASLAAGTQTLASFTVTSLAGDNVYVASIDPSFAAQDSNLANNVGTANLAVAGLPTLTASGSLSSGATSAGSPLALTVNVANGGIGDAADVPIVVYASLTAGGPSIQIGSGTISVAGLATASTVLNLNTSGLGGGTYTITVRVDPDETVNQTSTAGNTFTLSEVITGALVLTAPAEYLKLDATGSYLDIWNNTSGFGTPDYHLLLAGVGALSAAAASGSQNVTVDFSNGNPLPSGGFSFNGPGGGTNALRVIGTSGLDSFDLNGSTLTFGHLGSTATIARANVSSVTLDGNGGSDVINLNYAGGSPLPANLHVNGTFTMNGLQGFANTTLDLNRSTLYIAYTPGNDPLATIRQSLARGYNGGTWNGTATATAGAITSAAAALGTQTAIGYADAADITGVNPIANTIELKYTVKGDANLSGTVNFDDLLAVSQSYGQLSRDWDRGDFDYDGAVGFSDLLILSQAYGVSAGGLLVASDAAPSARPGRVIDELDM